MYSKILQFKNSFFGRNIPSELLDLINQILWNTNDRKISVCNEMINILKKEMPFIDDGEITSSSIINQLYENEVSTKSNYDKSVFRSAFLKIITDFVTIDDGQNLLLLKIMKISFENNDIHTLNLLRKNIDDIQSDMDFLEDHTWGSIEIGAFDEDEIIEEYNLYVNIYNKNFINERLYTLINL